MRPSPSTPTAGRCWRYPHYARDSDYTDRYDDVEGWYFRLALAFGLDINDDRDKLPPVEDGYEIHLLVGSDDGKARTARVHINWNGDPSLKPAEVLESGLDHLAVL